MSASDIENFINLKIAKNDQIFTVYKRVLNTINYVEQILIWFT
jgi:hypothetical protein